MKTIRSKAPKVLLVGYNGANNTGAEALLLADIQDIKAILGPNVPITVTALNPDNLRRYLQEDHSLRIARIPTIFFLAIWKLVRKNDLVLLVEGSCYMDTWTSALLWAFLWATWCAHRQGKPCLAFAVDAGKLSPFNQRQVERIASLTDLIITRTQTAGDRLRSWGVTAPIETTADNALTFAPLPNHTDLLKKEWTEAAPGVVGMALVNFYLWPVVTRLWGKKANCYRWPYYFSSSRSRRQAADTLVSQLASEADRIIYEHHRSIALIAMEELDEPFIQEVRHRMKYPEHSRIFSSRVYNASQITALLRNLELLITSRYHAGILSLAASVPQIAIGHDARLEGLYRDLGLKEEYFIEYCSSRRSETLRTFVDRVFANPIPIQTLLSQKYQELLAQAHKNRTLLRDFIIQQGWLKP